MLIGDGIMCGRTSLGGHEAYYDEYNNVWKYVDNNEIIDKNNERPCIKCSHIPTQDDHDYCIANLGNVMNACCGHGVEKGYIQFDNGITIRGYFEIERI